LNKSDLIRLEGWFRDFVSGYGQGGPRNRAAIEMKVEHSWRVADNMSSLAEGASLHWADPFLARAIGVLHDTGRFPQYQRYGTFRDPVSVNHGGLGAEVLGESGVLEALTPEDRQALLASVKYHNTLGLPAMEHGPMRYLRLIRDADKIDVWRVLAEHYSRPAGERLEAVEQGLSESPGCSPEVVECLEEGRVVPNAMARNSNDMRLHYVSWVYDMNYPASCRLALERGDLGRIASGLPESPGVSPAVEKALGVLAAMSGQAGRGGGQ
jgi:hypothetical protein